jgi:hypothetical protein
MAGRFRAAEAASPHGADKPVVKAERDEVIA